MKINLSLDGRKIPKELIKFMESNFDRRIIVTVGYNKGGVLKTVKGDLLGLSDDVIYIYRRRGKGAIIGFVLLNRSRHLIYEDGLAVNISMEVVDEWVIRRVFRSFESALKFLGSRELSKRLMSDVSYSVRFYVRWRETGGKKHYLIGEPIGVIERKKGGILRVLSIPLKLPLSVIHLVTGILIGRFNEIAEMARDLLRVYKREGIILLRLIKSDYKFDAEMIYVGDPLREDIPTVHVKPEVIAVELLKSLHRREEMHPVDM